MEKKRTVAYVIDPESGSHRYVTVDGIGECREPFAQLVHGMDLHPPDAVMVYKAEYLFVDTSPMWLK